jgi:hypothetical protein
MKKRRIIIVLIALTICYASGPFLAGAFRVGDRLGPASYPESFHETIYIMAHEAFHNEKPREPIDSWMYQRPLFYGTSRRLKSQQDREAYIEMARRNESPMLPRLIEMNEEANKTVQRTGASRSAQETNQTSSAAGSRR